MKTNTIKKSVTSFNLFIVATFIVLALYSAIGQQIFPYVGQYRGYLENYLGEQLKGRISIRNLSGAMDILTPSVHIEGVTLHTANDTGQPKISIAAIDAVLDPRASLANLTPVFKTVRLSGLYVRIDNSTQPQQPIKSRDARLIKRLVNGLLLQQNVELNNVTVEIGDVNDSQLLHLKHLVMSGDGFNRLVTGDVSYGNQNKVNAAVRLYTQGSPFDLDSFYARGEVDLPSVDAKYWLAQLFDVSAFKQFTASAQLNFEFKKSLLHYAKLSTASAKIILSDGRELSTLGAQIWGKQNAADNWRFWLASSQFTLKDKPWQFGDIAIDIAQTIQGNRWQTYVKSADLAQLHDFSRSLDIIPDALQPILNNLQPIGKLNNLNVILNNHSNGEQDYSVVGELNNVTTQASGAIPSASNISGVITASKESGRVQFTSPEMTLGFDQVYSAPLSFSNGQGQVDWHITDAGLRLEGDGLTLSMANAQSVKGGFKLWLYNNEQYEDKLELNLSLGNAGIGIHETLVPNMVSPKLKDWLAQSLLTGGARSAQYYLYMGLNKNSQLQSQLHLDVSQVAMQYLPQWPVVSDISGHVFVDNDKVYAQVKNANSLGGNLQHTQVVFDGVSNNRLWVQTNIQGQASEGFAYLQYTPLNQVVNEMMNPWTMTGEHSTALGLSIPLDSDIESSAIYVDLATNVSEADLNLTDLNLAFNQTQGHIYYRSSEGLSSSSLRSTLWQQPLALGISSDVHSNGFSTKIGFDGGLKIASLKQWLDLSLLQPIGGDAQVVGAFNISGQKNVPSTLHVRSNLNGVTIDLPAPYLKTADTAQVFDFKMALDDGQKITLNYDSRVHAALHLKQGQLTAGQVNLSSELASMPTETGLNVTGYVPVINADKWLDVWNNIQPENKVVSVKSNKNVKTKQGPLLINHIKLKTDQFLYDDFKFNDVAVDITTQQDTWNILLDAPVAKGRIDFTQNKPINLNLEYIHWPALTQNEEDPATQFKDPLINITPDALPEIDFNIGEIFVGPTNYGRWQGQVRTSDTRISIAKIDAEIKKLKVKGDVHWHTDSSSPPASNTLADKNVISTSAIRQRTKLNLTLSSRDIEGVQTSWREKPVIEAKKTDLSLNLEWQASPLGVKPELLNGQVGVSLKDGRFLDAGDTSALSAFGLLNFSAIGRRLRLDFSDLYQSGLHFDSVTGKANINDGVMTIIDTLNIKGPSAKFSASGTVNLNTKELNQALSVTFPLTSTLPFVAILAGFAPPIAASIFVGEQLVGDQIEKYTSATYRLTGPWDKPELKIMKRFDNEIEGKQDQGFWYRMKDFFGLGGD